MWHSERAFGVVFGDRWIKMNGRARSARRGWFRGVGGLERKGGGVSWFGNERET